MIALLHAHAACSILSLGPSFQVNAQAIATMEADLEMAVDLAYHVKGARLFFPASHGTSSGDFGPSDSSKHEHPSSQNRD